MSVVPFDTLKPVYTKLWAAASIKPERLDEFKSVTTRLTKSKDQYQAVEAASNVPWQMVAVIHEREAGGSFKGCLANGDPWNRVTRNDPAGEGPWSSWHEAAIWALKHDGLFGHPKSFWTIEQMLYFCERFNGFGYWLYHGKMPSPYVWGGTTVQARGKYVSDHNWSSTQWDTQLGCAGMLKLMLPPAIEVVAPLAADPPPPKVTTPVITPGTTFSWFEAFKKFWGRV